MQHGGADLQEPVMDQGDFLLENGDLNQRLQASYDAARSFILQPHKHGALKHVYNYPTRGLENGNVEITHALQDIFDNMNHDFKVSFSFGYILQELRGEQRYRYFIPYFNNTINPTPYYITGQDTLERVKERIMNLDIPDLIKNQRPNSVWRVVMITNINFYVYKTHTVIGKSDSFLPDYIRQMKCLVPLDVTPGCSRSGARHQYKDNLCAFRCLALFRRGYKRGDKVGRSFKSEVSKYYNTWLKYNDKNPRTHRQTKFPGLTSTALIHFGSRKSGLTVKYL